MSRVSIVIPCFNDGEHLLEAIDSAQAQTHPDIEIIVVNDGSTRARTLDVLEEIRRKGIVVISTPNHGLAAARNTGITQASGEYILPLDSDDLISKDYAKLASGILDAHPKVGIVGGRIQMFGIVTKDLTPTYAGPSSMLFRNSLYACSVFRRRDWELVNGYPENMSFAEDWGFWLRLIATGVEVHILPDLVWHYRQRRGQMSRSMKVGTFHSALIQVMYDQPELYASHMPEVTSFMNTKLMALDSFIRHFGRISSWLRTISQHICRSSRRSPNDPSAT